MPGDTLPDGTVLSSTKCAGRQDRCIYTSPTIRYSGLRFYATPHTFTIRPTDEHPRTPLDTTDGVEMCCQMVLQCRQQPGTFSVQSRDETLGHCKRGWSGDAAPERAWARRN
eukprot:gene57984-biopygen36884